MKILKSKKRIKTFLVFAVLISVLTLGCTIFADRKYKNEIEYIKTFLHYLSSGDEAEIRNRSTADAHFLQSPQYLSEASKLLKNIDIGSLKLLKVSEEKDNKLSFVQVYFEDDKSLHISLILKNTNGSWLIKSVSFSDTFS